MAVSFSVGFKAAAEPVKLFAPKPLPTKKSSSAPLVQGNLSFEEAQIALNRGLREFDLCPLVKTTGTLDSDTCAAAQKLLEAMMNKYKSTAQFGAQPYASWPKTCHERKVSGGRVPVPCATLRTAPPPPPPPPPKISATLTGQLSAPTKQPLLSTSFTASQQKQRGLPEPPRHTATQKLQEEALKATLAAEKDATAPGPSAPEPIFTPEGPASTAPSTASASSPVLPWLIAAAAAAALVFYFGRKDN